MRASKGKQLFPEVTLSSVCLHFIFTEMLEFVAEEASTGEERMGPIIYSGKYLFNKSTFYLEKFLIL
jgi:hypothetical protein